MGVVFCKFKRRCIFRKRGNVHLKETHSELTVDVVEFIFIFPEVFFQMLRVNVIKVVEDSKGNLGFIHLCTRKKDLSLIATRLWLQCGQKKRNGVVVCSPEENV